MSNFRGEPSPSKFQGEAHLSSSGGPKRNPDADMEVEEITLDSGKTIRIGRPEGSRLARFASLAGSQQISSGQPGPSDGIASSSSSAPVAAVDTTTGTDPPRRGGDGDRSRRPRLDTYAFDHAVYWTAGEQGCPTTTFRLMTGISWWQILVGGRFYRYRLWINTSIPYNYTFIDNDGDHYDLSVWRAGRHYVDYNSEKPDIVRVRGH